MFFEDVECRILRVAPRNSSSKRPLRTTKLCYFGINISAHLSRHTIVGWRVDILYNGHTALYCCYTCWSVLDWPQFSLLFRVIYLIIYSSICPYYYSLPELSVNKSLFFLFFFFSSCSFLNSNDKNVSLFNDECQRSTIKPYRRNFRHHCKCNSYKLWNLALLSCLLCRD